MKIELNKEQQRAVDHEGGPLLMIAGAGSGKTRALTERLKKLVQSGVLPHKIIAITFTNKAANEMRARVFGSENARATWAPSFPIIGKPFIGTFHSLGARILKEEIDFAFGRNKNFSIYDSANSLSLIKKILKDMNLSKDVLSPRKAMDLISWIKSELKDIDELDKEIATKKSRLREVFVLYEEGLRKNNAFDFDDLLEKPVKMLLENDRLRGKYQKAFTHLLVDEYQDINTIQYRLVKILGGGHRNITVVGDDAQAIYSFRGADFRNFLNFAVDWPETTTIKLEQNYRSTKNIIEAAGAVIENNKVQAKKTLWTNSDSGELVRLVAAEDGDIESVWVANEIRLLQDMAPEEEMAIIYRTNAQSRALEQALISENIGYKIYGGLKFYDRKEVKDVLSGIKLLINPQDTGSYERLEKALGKRVCRVLAEQMSKIDVGLAPAKILERFLEMSEYTNYLERKFDNSQERMENVTELTSFASQFTTLEEFLERVALLEATDGPAKTGANKNNEPVILMTIHMAKGLEFDNVFLVGCNEGLLPHEKSLSLDAEVEEERRLMYVAMTRAKKRLYVLFHAFPSRFIYEIPGKYLEFVSPTGLWDSMPSEEDTWIE